jgi:homoserine kinase
MQKMAIKLGYTCRAPATIANVFAGFDILGLALANLADEVQVSKIDSGVSISASIDLPLQPEKNTAGLPLLKIIEDFNLDFGFEVNLTKGIPLSAGLGGSAASSVGAVLAASAVLADEGLELSRSQQLAYALDGEAVASGSRHGDNVAACMYGGFTAYLHDDEFERVLELPFPTTTALLIHPHFEVETKTSRGILRSEVDLNGMVRQQMRLLALIESHRDPELLSFACRDLLIEPQRSHLIPAFGTISEVATEHGALGFTISGAGPTMLALCNTQAEADNISSAIADLDLSYSYDVFFSDLPSSGAQIRRG